MIEKNLVINSRELKYEGIFRADELFKIINKALEERGYQKREKKNEEIVTEQGKKVWVELRPYRETNVFITLMIKIRIILDNLTETKAEIQTVPMLVQQGKVKIIFDSYLLTNYEHGWEMQPWVFFMKQFVDKFIYPSKVRSKFRDQLVEDTAYIYAKIKKYVASFGAEDSKRIDEQKMRKDIEADILAQIDRESTPQ